MRTFLRTIALAALVLAGGNVDAQTINLNGNSDQIWHAQQAGAAAGQWLDLGAVSIGDNRSDLIIGAPGSASMPGAVYVIYGGPPRSGDLSLNNADAIISGTTNGDKFGFATAAGNVITPESSLTRNLVVGAPGRLLDGSRPDGDVAVLPELALVGEGLLGPRASDDLPGFLEARARLAERDVEDVVFARDAAGEAADDAAIR